MLFFFSIYDNINHMSIPSYAYCEPLPLDGYIFGADFDLEWTGSQFIAKWSNFTLSDADNSARVFDVALNPSYVYPLGGNIVGKSYFAAVPSDLQSDWHPCGVCGHPDYPAHFILDPTSMVNTTSLIHTFPRIAHLGSYLRQSDAAHPPNVDFLMIVEGEVSGMPPRYRANFPELFFKARSELPPGTVLYADIAAFFAFVAWTPEAQQNFEDPGWDSPFPASEPGVYFLGARTVSGPAPSGPLSLSPAAPGLSPVLSVLGPGGGDAALSAIRAPEPHAAGVVNLVDSPGRVFDSRSQFLVDDTSSIASSGIVQSSTLAAAQAFLTPRDARSKTEEAVILDAREGRTPARSSREDGYVVISKPGSIHRDWSAMIAYLVTELEVSRRAVTAQDFRQLKKWANNHGAVLRRAAQGGSCTSTAGSGLRPDGGAAPIFRSAKKRARAEEVVPAVEEVPVIGVSARARKGPRFFDPHGPPTEGDFASAGRRTAVPDFGAASSSSGISALSRVDSSVPSTVFGAATTTGASIVVESAPVVRASSVAPLVRNSEVGRGAILQAEVILAAALRELDSARASVVDCAAIALRGIDSARASVIDCTAAVSIARRHLGLGGVDDEQEAL